MKTINNNTHRVSYDRTAGRIQHLKNGEASTAGRTQHKKIIKNGEASTAPVHRFSCKYPWWVCVCVCETVPQCVCVTVWHEEISIKMLNIKSRFVIGPSNILYTGMHVYTFQPGNFTGCGSEGVKLSQCQCSMHLIYSYIIISVQQSVTLSQCHV